MAVSVYLVTSQSQGKRTSCSVLSSFRRIPPNTSKFHEAYLSSFDSLHSGDVKETPFATHGPFPTHLMMNECRSPDLDG